MNHAEVQAMLRQFPAARKTCEEAVQNLKTAYGERNEIYATGLSNLSAYLCQLGLYKEAKPYSRESLRIMMDLLGRDNDYTKSCWSNYYNILSKLNMKDEIQDLETEWKAASDTGGWLSGERPVPHEVMENLKKKLEERLTPPGPLDVGGFVKDPAFAKVELEKFVEEAKKKGLSPEDPAFLDVLEHEVSAIMDGKHKTEEALEAATQHVSDMADKMGPEWRRFVDQILVVAPSLDDAANAINEAGGLDPEFVAQEKAALQAEAENEKNREETMARGAQARAEKADIIEEQKRMAIRGSQFDE
jgi:tetratricopeptide (TPR) repeat protein